MDSEMEASPNIYDPENLDSREQFRRYKRRQSTPGISPLRGNSVSNFSEARLLYEGNNIQRRPNAALLLEEIKQEVENFDADGLDGTARKTLSSSKGQASVDSRAASELNAAFDSIRKVSSQSLKPCKHEDEVLVDGGETTFRLFASLLDSALQGLMTFPDLLLQFTNTCRNISESIRYGSTGRHRVVEDKFMQQKARLLLDEASSWSLLWHLFGKGKHSLTI